MAVDVVVANVDAEHLYADLLPEPVALARVRRVERSSSGFVVLIAAEGATPGLAHHHVWFAPDPDREFRQIFADRRMPDEPTIYACTSVVTDPTQAPAGTENWFLLVNAPSDPPVVGDADLYADHLLAVLARRGVDLRRRVIFRETVTPGGLADRYRSTGGAIYGTSSNGRRAAFLRPGNRGPRRGLYLAGGSSHPGGGLPLVATSARIVADLVREDGW
jgi:phytoene dehydrogenase-like protein